MACDAKFIPYSDIFSSKFNCQWLEILMQLVPPFSWLLLPSYYGAKCGEALEQI